MKNFPIILSTVTATDASTKQNTRLIVNNLPGDAKVCTAQA